jgi:bacterioferritin-associated ferredoxin
LGSWLPATPEYFGKDRKQTDGFHRNCRKCVNEYSKLLYKKNMQDETFRKKRVDHIRDYFNNNPDKKKQHHRRKAERRRERLSMSPEYKQRQRSQRSEYSQRYRKTLTGRIKNKLAMQRRKARCLCLPDTLTEKNWDHALEYFHGCCAVCGRQLNDLFGEHTAAMDHWIPLSSPDCPGTVTTNIIPLCHGIDGCNQSKGAREPLAWLKWKFGKRKAKQILKRIQAYFDSIS